MSETFVNVKWGRMGRCRAAPRALASKAGQRTNQLRERERERERERSGGRERKWSSVGCGMVPLGRVAGLILC